MYVVRKNLESIFPWRYRFASLNKKLDDILNILQSRELDTIHNDQQRLLEIQKALNSKNNELLEKIELLNRSLNSNVQLNSGIEKSNELVDKNMLEHQTVSNNLITSISR